MLGALNLIKTEYCPKWKMLDHWKLAKDLCVCVCVCVCVEREREREMKASLQIQKELGEWVAWVQCVHTCVRSEPPHQSYQPTTFPLSIPALSIRLPAMPCPAMQQKKEALHSWCMLYYLITSYLDIKGSSLLQWGGVMWGLCGQQWGE